MGNRSFINSNNIYINQELYIPTTSEQEPPLPIPPIDDDENEEYSEYIVQKGDSLWLISRKYNISVKELIDLNNLTTTSANQNVANNNNVNNNSNCNWRYRR